MPEELHWGELLSWNMGGQNFSGYLRGMNVAFVEGNSHYGRHVGFSVPGPAFNRLRRSGALERVEHPVPGHAFVRWGQLSPAPKPAAIDLPGKPAPVPDLPEVRFDPVLGEAIGERQVDNIIRRLETIGNSPFLTSVPRPVRRVSFDSFEPKPRLAFDAPNEVRGSITIPLDDPMRRIMEATTHFEGVLPVSNPLDGLIQSVREAHRAQPSSRIDMGGRVPYSQMLPEQPRNIVQETMRQHQERMRQRAAQRQSNTTLICFAAEFGHGERWRPEDDIPPETLQAIKDWNEDMCGPMVQLTRQTIGRTSNFQNDGAIIDAKREPRAGRSKCHTCKMPLYPDECGYPNCTAKMIG